METDKISIIIITLNEVKNISNILNDLSNQTFKEFEIIISDSNSTDNTKKIVLEKSKEFKEFLFINCKKTLWPSYWRNYWVKFAKYERLLFLDADTRIKDNKFLEKFIKLVNERKIDSWWIYIEISNNNFIEKLGLWFINLWYFFTQYFSPTACWACMFSTQTVHNKINWFRENVLLCEDCDYVRDARMKAFNVRMLNLKFNFSDRRLRKWWYFKTGFLYIKANFIRFLTWKSILKDKIKYDYNNY